MASVGRNIEVAIQAMLKVSEEVADLQALLNNATNDLNMLETLFSVSKYIGLNPQQHIMMSVLEDSIKGVFGANYCQVMFDKNKTHMSNSKILYEHMEFNTLKDQVSDILIIEDVSESEIIDFKEGSLIVVKLAVGEELYGFLVCYWQLAHNLSDSSILFLQIISNQVSMFLKSNALIDEFKALAVIDPLTGIYNRSYYINIEENTTPVLGDSIIVFDIDHFKKVNDSMGHQFGDKVLIEFAEILTEISEEIGGTAFKYGGEEFVIKCGGGIDTAWEVAEKVRKRFKSQTGYTVSAGIGTLGVSSRVSSYHVLFELADGGLYVSKQTGRDKTTISNGDIQVLKTAGQSLIKMVSRSYRSSVHMSMYRVILRDEMVITTDKYQEIKSSLASIGRIYDEILVTESLDVIVIVDGRVNTSEFEARLNQKLNEVFGDLKYDVYNLKEIFDEVIQHSTRVVEITQFMTSKLAFDQAEASMLKSAVEWHDIGKLCIDPDIYLKKSKVSDKEYESIKMHAWLSYHLADMHPKMNDVSKWILYHHENNDGSGYYGLKGNDIPFEAKLIGIVDRYDALTINREHRKAYSWKEALKILDDEKDKYDIDLLKNFSMMITSMMEL